MKTKWLVITIMSGAGAGLLSCNPDATLFSDAFISLSVGGLEPVAPGPDAGYVMALVDNSTNQSIEFVVTAEQEQIIVRLDGQGVVESFEQPRILDPVTINLVTDVATPTLAFVFGDRLARVDQHRWASRAKPHGCDRAQKRAQSRSEPIEKGVTNDRNPLPDKH